MNTKQIIHKTEAAAIEEVESLEAKIKHLHTKGTTNYTYYIKHPKEDLWAVRYNVNNKIWPLIESHLSTEQKNNLVDITKDWIGVI